MVVQLSLCDPQTPIALEHFESNCVHLYILSPQAFGVEFERRFSLACALWIRTSDSCTGIASALGVLEIFSIPLGSIRVLPLHFR